MESQEKFLSAFVITEHNVAAGRFIVLPDAAPSRLDETRLLFLSQLGPPNDGAQLVEVLANLKRVTHQCLRLAAQAFHREYLDIKLYVRRLWTLWRDAWEHRS
jgi:hypothetical protein